MNAQPSGIELTAKYFILSFLVVIFPLTITVDGKEIKGSWGTNFYPVEPGTHSVSASYKLYWVLPWQKGSTSVTVPEGGRVKLQYYVPWLFLLPGKLTTV
jgi:hypothetical protein